MGDRPSTADERPRLRSPKANPSEDPGEPADQTTDTIWRVLLVDDDVPIRTLLRHAVGRDDRFEVAAEADDGVDALEMLDTHDPDLLLLDLAMPRLDGLGVLEALDGRSRPVVVVFTGLDGGRAEEAVERGAAAAFTKDVAFDELAERLAGLLSRHR